MTDQLKKRVHPIDIVRGIIIIIMTLDHVRDFFHIHAMDENPLDVNNPLIFFTRWITHYCAPTFVFLSGVSAWLAGRKKTKKQLSIFLIKRGAWLIAADIIIMSFGFTFNPLYNLIILEVLWAIGGGMIILGLLIRTSLPVIIATAAVIFFVHNLLDYVTLPANAWGTVVRVFVSGAGALVPLSSDGSRNMLIGYAPITWSGVLLFGYVAGHLYDEAKYTAQQRQKTLMIAGCLLIALFILLRVINKYGDPAPWAEKDTASTTFLSFLNVSKYPPSLIFCCMTLGPVLILLALTERLKGRFAEFVTVYGKVPFFYFIMHFYLAHFLTVIAFFATGYGWKDRADPASLFLFRPQHFGFNIWWVYVIWLSVVLIMYLPCRWFGRYRAEHRYWWLSYV